MNKYLLMRAAAVMAAMASSGVAQANTTVHFKSSGGNSYCDYLVISPGAGGLYAAVHVGAVNCAGSSLEYDAGVKGKKDKLLHDTSVQLADTSLAKAGTGWEGLVFDLGFPLGSGPFCIITGGTSRNVSCGTQAPGKPGAKAKSSALSQAIGELRRDRQ